MKKMLRKNTIVGIGFTLRKLDGYQRSTPLRTFLNRSNHRKHQRNSRNMKKGQQTDSHLFIKIIVRGDSSPLSEPSSEKATPRHSSKTSQGLSVFVFVRLVPTLSSELNFLRLVFVSQFQMEPQCHTQFHLGAEWSQRRQCVKGRYFQRKKLPFG